MSYITSYVAETSTGTVTSWLPIITPFSAASVSPGCSYPAVAQTTRSSRWMAYYGWGSQLEACLPTEVYKWWQTTSKPTAGLYTIFSMGPIVCPTGYTTATEISIAPRRFQVACCPTDYTLQYVAGPADDGQCISSVSAGRLITYQKIIHRALDASGQPSTKWNISTTRMATPTVVAALPFNGVNIMKATSTVTPPGNPQSSLDPSGSTLPATLRVTTSRDSPSSAANGSNGFKAPISPKTVVALGVGSGAAMMIIIGIFIWLVMWHRRRSLNHRRNGKVFHQDISWPLELRQELPGENNLFEVHGEHKRFELSCNAGLAHELDQPHQILELDCRGNVHHLERGLRTGPGEPICEPFESRRGLCSIGGDVTPVDVISPL
ncbi:hypothetical protein GLAREA_10080 [Glarea lozoyensis ATCC 20868]|uniref:Uncharacterized protein n=1 Tax=Glarea lozoyensis (strain ATCC 20868 / MF5171) TaxID=1116229 RepID=S3DQT8_GLAL2|nr:uncharacterized protein GLAREA_10080 [Glarea lozoyensis ATCC 20868]EPE34386.1 hypothetical protein GLAREA_10080 [Glarea lozoyensis ATCC 20868]